MNWFHVLLLLAVVGGLGYLLIWSADCADEARRDRASRGEQ